MASSAPVLPLELHLDIVDYLCDDKCSLRNCSVVCQAWLPYIRSHLWKEIALTPRGDGSSSDKPLRTKQLLRPWSYRATSMADAISFFAARPDIAKVVKWIGIDGFAGVAVDTFSSLLTALPNVVHLDVINTDFLPIQLASIHDADKQKLGIKPVYTHRLDDVRIDNCNIVERDNVETLLQVLGLFSFIFNLKLWGPKQFTFDEIQRAGWVFDPAIHLRHNVPLPPPPVVFYLSVDRIHPTTIRYLFKDTGLCRMVKMLMFCPMTIWTYGDLAYMANTLLPLVRSTLDMFFFGPGMPLALPGDPLEASPEGQREIDAAFTRIAQSCACMKHISLMLAHNRIGMSKPLDYSYLFDGFVKVLWHMPSDASFRLEGFGVSIMAEDAMGLIPPQTVRTMDVLKGYNWAGLEQALLAKARRKVKVYVQIVFIAPLPSEEEKQDVIKHLKERMPELVGEKRLELIICGREGWSW